ncbi:MAG: hypothetical protein DI543_02650 [Bradyrhizobium icense]|jgi:hypothetical protein|nr:MAG: hypothetical protein DI543_02650 [Bradyrhizobium icense]
MLRQLIVALAALAVLATANVAAKAQRQIGKPKFEDIKLQTGVAQSASSKNTVRGGGFFQVRDQGG